MITFYSRLDYPNVFIHHVLDVLKLTEISSTIFCALSLTFWTCALTFSAACADTVTSRNTSSAFLEATANSFSFTASSLDSSFTAWVASTSFFRPEERKYTSINHGLYDLSQSSIVRYPFGYVYDSWLPLPLLLLCAIHVYISPCP